MSMIKTLPHKPSEQYGFVPWITLWTGEAEEKDLKSCPYADGALALWHPTRRDGRPLFAEKHVVRERMAVSKDLCGICGKPLKRGDRWIFAKEGPLINVNGVAHRTLPDSPSHKGCALVASELCPILRREGLSPIRLPSKTRLVKVATPSAIVVEGQTITYVKTICTALPAPKLEAILSA